MQKVAASAGEFDLSFEWLGAYIATISEVTRQAPEVVGTALNRMFSRLRNVRQTGYNEDDDTKINDIAKALNEVDIALFDSQGNWRNIADILSDVVYDDIVVYSISSVDMFKLYFVPVNSIT